MRPSLPSKARRASPFCSAQWLLHRRCRTFPVDVTATAHFRILARWRAGLFRTSGKPVHPRELAEHACIQFRIPNTGKLQVWLLRRDTDEVEAQLSTTVTCNTNEARLCFALEGFGIAYMSDFTVRDALVDGRLVTVLEGRIQPVDATV
ncbi:hypothetical protein CUJ91_31960 (plasmid) [Paraburkholderia graminis]|uniref:LysR substrate-binding domain-containing protein n=1 Tax=Paraburkholderia graminis TaxID=60548 RepID=UPI000DEEF6EA|nr:hypothetical protein CUJ91_31960 [Paraburkholderia graminis]